MHPRVRLHPSSAAILLLIAAAAGPAGAAAPPSPGGPGGACDPGAEASRRSRYHLSPGPEGTWTGVNPAHRLHLEISEAGPLLASPAPGRPAWTWSLGPVAWETLRERQVVEGRTAFAQEERIELTLGRLTEWFSNGPKGIEHGLVLPPLAEPRLVQVDFALGGTLTPKVAEDGRAIAFVDRIGAPVLAYRELRGVDADGRDVSVRWERLEKPAAPPGRLRLLVDGGGHADPIRVMGIVVGAKGAAAGCGAEPESLDALVPLAAPDNDLCAGAEVIPGAGPFPYLSGTHDLTDATTDGDPPLPSCQTNLSRSVWFAFTPAASGSYALSLCADGPTGTSVEDTVLAVYGAAGDCAGLAEVEGGCDDDSCDVGDLQSVIAAVDLSAGTPYYVVAWKYGATAPAAGLGAIQLRVSQNPAPAPAPPNDRCEGAEVIPGAGPFPYLTSVTSDVSGATTAGDPPAPTCQPNVSRSVWYSFTPAGSGRYTFSLCADAPTGTTVDDTTMAIYQAAGTCSGFTQVDGACDDDSCTSEAAQSLIRGVPLAAGTTYSIVVWQYGLLSPAPGNTAIQLRVSEERAPANDTCGSAPALALDAPLAGTTANAGNDYQLPEGSTCFTGIGQTPSTTPGGDVSYSFTAPRDGPYSFRVSGFETARDAVLYVAAACPEGPAPAEVSSCLGAANRNAGYPGEEVFCLPLAAGQAVVVFVDGNVATAGSPFTIEVNECRREAAANDAPGAAGEAACGVTGSISPAGDADFYLVGTPQAGSRLFALIDGAAANSTDFDLRVTTDADTLEYDDLDNDTPFGNVSPNVAATPLHATPAYIRVSHFSGTTQAEPYRLYAAVQPPPAGAAPEVEPNETPATATTAPGLYFAGTLSGTSDVDLFSFTARAGDLIHLGLDLDASRDGTPFNGVLALLDASGTTLVAVNDGGSTSSTTPGGASLNATTPASPGEGIVHRARADGTYLARVGFSSGTPGDYLLSIARNCTAGSPPDADGDGVPDASDCAPGDPSAWSVPGEATDLLLEGGAGATEVRWSPPASPGGRTVYYDLLRSEGAANFGDPTCIVSGGTVAAATDGGLPERALFYLVRAWNVCGGNLGTASDGTPRLAGACP